MDEELGSQVGKCHPESKSALYLIHQGGKLWEKKHCWQSLRQESCHTILLYLGGKQEPRCEHGVSPSLEKEKAKNSYPRKLLLPLSVFPVLFKESKRAKRRSCFAALHKHPQIRVVPGVSLPCKVTEMSRIVFPLLPFSFLRLGTANVYFKDIPCIWQECQRGRR